ncbi:MAG: hypothetical protein DRJ33_08020 [Candidatus Methanomethylicota archaeon]|uniref:Polymerase nucleotidyl transferase domain-containing protein n=1 Tax=Thermoproteota archaeon TaxID=2056631 RepID=A0A497ESJ5_9CREN|nr:MAG: hypothetical protein DRJ33_08020 [Candidatus Verstraetearchaeota archaeon]
MWLPRWLGEVYAKLFMCFGVELFTFDDALKVLNVDRAWLNVVFSKLHAKRVLCVYERSRPRLYRLLKPESFMAVAAGVLKNLDRVKQERYLQLICDVALDLIKRFNASSVCVYGSVARGKARLDSDLDVLVVSSVFKGSLTSRVEELCSVEDAVADELGFLKKRGVYASLSFYPLREDEVPRFPLVLLDVLEDGVIVYDRDFFLEKALAKFRERLARLGAKRVFISEDSWYWDLKPGYVFGEVIEI